MSHKSDLTNKVEEEFKMKCLLHKNMEIEMTLSDNHNFISKIFYTKNIFRQNRIFKYILRTNYSNNIPVKRYSPRFIPTITIFR